jgi:hypothetical protein
MPSGLLVDVRERDVRERLGDHPSVDGYERLDAVRDGEQLDQTVAAVDVDVLGGAILDLARRPR